MREENITIGTKYPLKGKLTLPEGSGPFPAVVLVHGSGSSDMDSKVHAVTPFKDIAEGLAVHGVAAIRFDKRTWTHGRQVIKDYKKNFSVNEESIEDAIFAKDLLSKDERINPSQIYIAGLSLGGMLAPRITAEGDFAGTIILAGSPRKIEDVLMGQQNDFLATAKGLIKWLANKQISKLQENFKNIDKMTDEEAMNKNFAGGATYYYMKEMGSKPARLYLENSEKPVLVMHGEMDVQVSLKHDFEAYKEILKNHPDATLKLYPGLGHAFTKTENAQVAKAMKDFKRPGQIVDSKVIKDIAEWVAQRG